MRLVISEEDAIDAEFVRADVGDRRAAVRGARCARIAGTTLNGTVTAAMFDTDPALLPLDENALTPIHPLPATSPVLDRGSNPGNLGTDQRGPGYPRAASSMDGGPAVTDIGAYEFRVDRIFFGDYEAH